MKQGWISLHRQILDNELWDDKPFARGQAWIDLLLMVNHEPRKIVFGKSAVFVGRGSTITSIRKLAERWGWSRHKTDDFLDLLVSLRMAKIERDTKKTVITIANYNFFQDSQKEKSHQRATEEPPRDTNNNGNNENKEIRESTDVVADAPSRPKRERTFTPPTLDEVRAYCTERNSDVDPKRFFDFFTEGDWRDSRGNRVRSWKQKLITWENHTTSKQTHSVQEEKYEPLH